MTDEVPVAAVMAAAIAKAQTSEPAAPIEHHYFDCQCSDIEHALRFTLDVYNDERWPSELYVDVHLTQYKSFWKRLWSATRYVFGKAPHDGDWGSWLMKPQDATRVIELLQRYVAMRQPKPELLTETTDG